jgi:membrane protein YqaA with SNARE-associated domain
MLEQLGLFGLFLGCMLSATVVPFASEALLAGALLMGYGKWAVTLVATLGNTTGGMISYLMGWLCKWEWLEKYFRVKREKLERMRDRVAKYGAWAALLTWLPFVGDLIAIAMGLMRVNPWWTLLLMLIGKLARYVAATGLLAFTGMF